MNIKILIVLGALNVCKHVTLRMILSEQVNVTGFCNTYYICILKYASGIMNKIMPQCIPNLLRSPTVPITRSI